MPNLKLDEIVIKTLTHKGILPYLNLTKFPCVQFNTSFDALLEVNGVPIQLARLLEEGKTKVLKSGQFTKFVNALLNKSKDGHSLSMLVKLIEERTIETFTQRQLKAFFTILIEKNTFNILRFATNDKFPTDVLTPEQLKAFADALIENDPHGLSGQL
jgi:hypothetical protein